MKVAILIYGQPRFFDKTVTLIKEEFTIPGWDTDFFIHNWDKIGHTPECDQNENLEQFNPNKTILNTLQPKAYKVESYDALNTFTTHLLNSMNYINRPMAITNTHNKTNTTINRERYYFGQHISIYKCFKEICKQEQLTGKYDLIIKVRPDIVYKPQYLYNSSDEYIKAKLKKYHITETQIPTCSVNALRINRLTGEGDILDKKWKGEILTNFYLNKYTTETGDNATYKWDYWERLCFNDWLLICNRKAADIYFNKWFENFFITMGKDLYYNNDRFRWMSRSDHCMQGQLAINYNVKLHTRGKRRDRKIISAETIKENIDLNKKIILKKTDDEDILNNKIKQIFK